MKNKYIKIGEINQLGKNSPRIDFIGIDSIITFYCGLDIYRTIIQNVGRPSRIQEVKDYELFIKLKDNTNEK